MAEYKVYKETVLPGTLSPHSIYLIATVAHPEYVEMYVTGSSASTVKRIISHDDIQSLINSSMAAAGKVTIVADIAARNALALTNALTVLVKDATGDPTVALGGATYVYELATTTWVKITEHGLLDLAVSWSGISGKPDSPVADIDDAVTKRHAHLNKTQLDKIGESGGSLTYNGSLPHTGWDSTGW